MAIFAPILLIVEAVIAAIALGLNANTLHKLVRLYRQTNDDRHDGDTHFFKKFGKDESFDHARILVLLFAGIVAMLASRLLAVPLYLLARCCRAVRDRVGHRMHRHSEGGWSWLYIVPLFAIGTAAWVVYGLWIGLSGDASVKNAGDDIKDGALYVWDRLNGDKGDTIDLARAALAFWVLAVVTAIVTSIALIFEERSGRGSLTQDRNEPYNTREAKHADVEQAQQLHAAS